MPHRLLVLLTSPLLAALGVSCTEETPGWTVLEDGRLTPAQESQAQRALDARNALFTELLGELTTALDDGDPASAISVCREVAPRISREVSTKLALQIGRTSFRLRNPANAPPDWAAGLVEKRENKRIHVASDDGRLGVLLPITLSAPCVTCHGREEEIPPPVQTALQQNYPRDQATGFRVGDLRGWFWVEVPPLGPAG
jgi:hypothetical protein